MAGGGTVAAAAVPELAALRVDAVAPPEDVAVADGPGPVFALEVAAAAAEPTFRRRLPSFDTTILIFSLPPQAVNRLSSAAVERRRSFGTILPPGTALYRYHLGVNQFRRGGATFWC